MTRTVEERVADVRRLLRGAGEVYRGRAALSGAIASATGLTTEGVELGFASLEREATDSELRALVAAAGDASKVHVVLSANVFVAPLRALALARAAAPFVSVRPSSRDPLFTRALVEATGDAAISVVGERDLAAIDAGAVHVYGRDETIAAARARARAAVRGHGAGMGVALVTRTADADGAAASLAGDVAAFDQRGCLSPRVALVEGDSPRAEAVALALDRALGEVGARVPRGTLSAEERSSSVRWMDAAAFAGRLWKGPAHAVAIVPGGSSLAIPPPGRHVLVVRCESLDDASAALAPIARFVVAVGSDDPARIAPAAPKHARVSALGRMQRPPLDGPVDRRAELGEPAF